MTRDPRRYWRGLANLVTLPHRPRILALRAPILFFRAAWIASRIERAGGCRYVHGHFALAQTEVAMAVAGLIDRPFGFTAHARDIYATPSALVEKIRAAGIRMIGPNCMGIINTDPRFRLNATFSPVYPPEGRVAFSTQSGALGLAILSYVRTLNLGISSFASIGNKADVSGNDLIQYWAEDPKTDVILLYLESFGNPAKFAQIARRVGRSKPIVAVKAGRSGAGARAASSHTGARATSDTLVDTMLRQSGVIRARSLREMLEFARALPIMPTPKGDNIVIITGAGGSGVLLSDAVVDNDLSLMTFPPDLDAAFKKFIPPFGASGNPVDITGGEPPKTYQNTVRFGLEDPRIHALILGYWHTIVTPPMVFAKLLAEIVEETRAKGIDKPVVVSLAGDVEVEEASEYLFAHRIPAYPYSTEIPVDVLGAKYKWARGAGLL